MFFCRGRKSEKRESRTTGVLCCRRRMAADQFPLDPLTAVAQTDDDSPFAVQIPSFDRDGEPGRPAERKSRTAGALCCGRRKAADQYRPDPPTAADAATQTDEPFAAVPIPSFSGHVSHACDGADGTAVRDGEPGRSVEHLYANIEECREADAEERWDADAEECGGRPVGQTGCCMNCLLMAVDLCDTACTVM